MWDKSKCDYCGICLLRCQYVDYGKEKAVQEIAAVIDGKDAEILRECVNCLACNEYCPKGADPWDLIVDRRYERGLVSPHVAEKVKERVQYRLLMPNSMTPGGPDKPVLCLGHYGLMTETAGPDKPVRDLRTAADSYQLGGQLFEGLGVISGGDYYSALSTAVRYGMGHPTRDMVQRFIGNLAKVGAKEIVFIKPDDYVNVIRARHYGIDLPFRPIHIFEYLYNYLNDHQDNITRLGRRVAYHRNCWSRLVPDDQEAFLDKIFDLIGVERVARRYDRKNALCCGVRGIAYGLSPEKFARNMEMNLNDAKESGAEAMVEICQGCVSHMGKASESLGMPPIFVHDLCRMALGEKTFP